jgi:hypothetical protein
VSEVEYLLRLIEGTPDHYTGYSDAAEALDVSMDEFEDSVVELRLISRELEKRDRIDG